MARPKLAQCFDARAPLKAVGARHSLSSICSKPALRLPQGTRKSGFDSPHPPGCISAGGGLGTRKISMFTNVWAPVLAARTIRILPIARFFKTPRPSAAKRGHNRSTINPRRAGPFLTISQLFTARSSAPLALSQLLSMLCLARTRPQIHETRTPTAPDHIPVFSIFINVMGRRAAAPINRRPESNE